MRRAADDTNLPMDVAVRYVGGTLPRLSIKADVTSTAEAVSLINLLRVMAETAFDHPITFCFRCEEESGDDDERPVDVPALHLKKAG